ncbi:LysE family translocator [Magnetofaba australis]|uniref:Putative lysine exporter protein LysE/YggA n=1 Tax=Magnetofaba australis IT-1 TaxID=1434232 RepID=A0A1Y2K7P5_9PROT|nr:LysE family translocator [Magnetofaba australis]OSM06258.1 putative lysine exporter protein LysE/YggA [Magnetofaba australis IT-1]
MVEYITVVWLFLATPGPSHLLMLANGVSYGFAHARPTAWGDLSANALQIMAAGFGLAGIIIASEDVFTAIKWAGVAYLIYLAAQKWRLAGRSVPHCQADSAAPGWRRMYLQGFFTSAVNPKAVVFFAALFPQFLNLQEALAPQVAILGALYLLIDGAYLLAYGRFAAWVGARMQSRAAFWTHRAAAACLIATAVLLAWKDAQLH